MRRNLASLCAVIALSSLAACGSNEQNPTSSATDLNNSLIAAGISPARASCVAKTIEQERGPERAAEIAQDTTLIQEEVDLLMRCSDTFSEQDLQATSVGEDSLPPSTEADIPDTHTSTEAAWREKIIEGMQQAGANPLHAECRADALLQAFGVENIASYTDPAAIPPETLALFAEIAKECG